MKISDLEFEMELGGVDKADIAEIVELYANKDINTELIDKELERRGYPKVFSVDYDAYDEYADWVDDEYESIQKFPHKQQYRD